MPASGAGVHDAGAATSVPASPVAVGPVAVSPVAVGPVAVSPVVRRRAITATATAARHTARAALTALTACLLACAALPAGAFAEATPGPEPVQGAPGLPDGRVYEVVSPLNTAATTGPERNLPPVMFAGAGGNEVAFFNTGPMGETQTGWDFWSVAHRTANGWHTRGALPRAPGQQGTFRTEAEHNLGFSSEMGSTIFSSHDVFGEDPPSSPAPHLYRYREGGEVQWLARPAIAHPVSLKGLHEYRVAGASPSFSTVFFDFEGALVPADEEPNPQLGGLSRVQEIEAKNASGESQPEDLGFYEWHEGGLENAGVLPDGRLDPFGAAPAATPQPTATGISAENLDNQVAGGGTRAFFVSPDPAANSGRPTELYVRETAADGSHHSVLVSRDMLLPEEHGEPASAPAGVLEGAGAKGDGEEGNQNASSAYIYASPNGARVFFQSLDPLTASAPNQTETVKQYVFDTETGTLTYLPGVADVKYSSGASPVRVLVSSASGSSFLFARQGGGIGSREESLDVWHEGAISEIAQIETRQSEVTYARAAASGATFVFQTSSPFAGMKFNNGGGQYQQIYRYEVASDRLSCISCASGGVAAAGNARLSNAYPDSLAEAASYVSGNLGVSEEGNRVFFETPTALVRQDTNGVSDVYEWENGAVYLISSGVSPSPSYIGDNSPSGNDVFFSTAEGLVPSDKNETYDVYDARVPRPGDTPPVASVPCEGSVCQGPPSAPNLLTAPASASFSGTGNLLPAPAAAAPAKTIGRHKGGPTRAARLRRALRACRRHARRHGRERRRCEARARRRYRASSRRRPRKRSHGSHHGSRAGRHQNRRGK
ncbi:MAG: hypothetical protein ACYCUM_08600 [Solirubrobacteraceae bacterium]